MLSKWCFSLTLIWEKTRVRSHTNDLAIDKAGGALVGNATVNYQPLHHSMNAIECNTKIVVYCIYSFLVSDHQETTVTGI